MSSSFEPIMYPLADGREVVIRPFLPADSIPELTLLIRSAYRSLGEAGLKYVGVNQSERTTQYRVSDSKCHIATLDGTMVGTIAHYPKSRSLRCSWYQCDGHHFFGQFAVLPILQHCGLGGRLIEIVENEAREDGALELALDTAEPATHLTAYYAKRGYRFIQYIQWPDTNYRSVVMSKALQ